MIIGHKKIKNELERALEKGVLSHAYVFAGPEAVGKFSLALEFSAKINGAENKMDPDLVILSPRIEEVKGVEKRKDIGVEEIRELQRKIITTPGTGKHRIAIINDAETMTKGAQNALLKILEEAPQKTILILIVHNLKKILPTVLSRCQTKKFSILSDDEIRTLVIAENENRDEIVFWSFGRPGWAKEMNEDESKLNDRKEILRRLENIMKTDLNGRFDLAETLAKDAPNLSHELDMWIAIFREDMVGKGILKVKKEKALEIIEAILESKRMLEDTNANARLIVENLLIRF